MEIRLDGWRLNLTFAAAHFISDYSKCSRLHGHSYAVSIIIKGEPKDGIIVDFVALKESIKKIIEEIDHKVIIPIKSGMKINYGEEIEILHKGKRYVFPKEDCALLSIESSSAENIASYILQKFLKNFEIGDNIEEIFIGIDEGYGQGAWVKRKIK